jgi:peptidyl-prolyl cis-trans isomerase C
LVKDEAEAKKLIADLDKGAKFADLANKHSLDAKESQNGGELGWFAAGQMVEPFSEAVAKLEKGKYSKEPVKTQFGYHIILREDSRAQTPPPFDAVKEQLKPLLERKKVQKMVEEMRKQAKVEILVPLTDDKPKADDKAAAGQNVVEETAEVIEEKSADGKTVAKEVVDVVEEKTADGKPVAEVVEVIKEQPATDKKEAAPAKHHETLNVKPDAKAKKDDKK